MKKLRSFGQWLRPVWVVDSPTWASEPGILDAAQTETALMMWGDPLTHRTIEHPITFDDIRRQPDPEWARPTAARQQRWAQGRADAAYDEIGPYGPLLSDARKVKATVVQGHFVLDEIHYAVALLYEAATAGLADQARTPHPQ